MTLPIQHQLADLVGLDAVTPQDRLAEYAIDGVTPRAVVEAPDRQAVAELLAWAAARRLPVFPRGGGTQMGLGNAPGEVGLVLAMGRQSRVLDYEPADLTATVEAGISLDRLREQLSAWGQFLPLESPQPGKSTIGGVLAANTTGAMRHSYGQPRDWLIGVAVVGADGRETKAGGRVVKNVTGYDLNKLYTGSMGTLGVIVEATFKLSPAPARRGALAAEFGTLAEAISAGRSLLRQACAPQAVQVVDGLVAQRLAAGRAGAPVFTRPRGPAGDGDVVALALFAGRPRALQRRMEECARILGELGESRPSALDDAESVALVQGLNAVTWSGERNPDLVIKLNLPPASLAETLQRLREESPPGLPPGVAADPGFGTARMLWWPGPDGERLDEAEALGVIARAREAASSAGGFAVVEYCPPSLKRQTDVWGGAPQGLEVMRRIKLNFDPRGILNPGRFVGGL